MPEPIPGAGITEAEARSETLGASCGEVFKAMTDREGMATLNNVYKRENPRNPDLRTLVSFEANKNIKPEKGETVFALSLMSPDSRKVVEGLMPDHVHYVPGETFTPETEAAFESYLLMIAADEVSRGGDSISSVDAERSRRHNATAESFLGNFRTYCAEHGNPITTTEAAWNEDKQSMIEPFARACIRAYAGSAEARERIEAEKRRLTA